MARKEMQRYFTTLKVAIVVSIITAIGLLIALITSNMKPQGIFTGTTTTRTMLTEPCTMDGMEHCKAVRVYEDGELVEFYVMDEE